MLKILHKAFKQTRLCLKFEDLVCILKPLKTMHVRPWDMLAKFLRFYSLHCFVVPNDKIFEMVEKEREGTIFLSELQICLNHVHMHIYQFQNLYMFSI